MTKDKGYIITRLAAAGITIPKGATLDVLEALASQNNVDVSTEEAATPLAAPIPQDPLSADDLPPEPAPQPAPALAPIDNPNDPIVLLEVTKKFATVNGCFRPKGAICRVRMSKAVLHRDELKDGVIVGTA